MINVSVEGFVQDIPGLLGDTERKQYKCFISYSSVSENSKIVKDYFRDYYGINYDKLKYFERPPLDDYNLNKAILTYYFKEQFAKFEYKSREYIRPSSLPDREPDKETEHYKVWVELQNVEKITTPKSAAWLLYEITINGKVSIECAKEIVHRKYPEHIYSWQKILSEFCSYGGAYTKKYLRRRNQY